MKPISKKTWSKALEKGDIRVARDMEWLGVLKLVADIYGKEEINVEAIIQMIKNGARHTGLYTGEKKL